MSNSTILTAYDVSNVLRISYENALNYIKYSGIPYFKIGRTYRIYEADLKAFLDKEKKKLK